jgi:GntR family transcriptional repressor for pyruvate dehydrogenase complex
MTSRRTRARSATDCLRSTTCLRGTKSPAPHCASGNPLFGLLTSALHLLTRDLSRQLGYSEHERENQVRRLARVVHAVRLRDPVTARREMERLVQGSAEYLGRRSPDLMDQQVRWTQAFEA